MYVNIFSEVMLVLGICIKCVSRLCSYFPFRILRIIEFVGWNIVGSFRGLLTITVHLGHLLGNELLRFCLSCGSSEWKFRCGRFCRIFDFSKCRINFGIGELDQILISVHLFLLFLLCLIVFVVHNLFVNK